MKEINIRLVFKSKGAQGICRIESGIAGFMSEVASGWIVPPADMEVGESRTIQVNSYETKDVVSTDSEGNQTTWKKLILQ